MKNSDFNFSPSVHFPSLSLSLSPPTFFVCLFCFLSQQCYQLETAQKAIQPTTEPSTAMPASESSMTAEPTTTITESTSAGQATAMPAEQSHQLTNCAAEEVHVDTIGNDCILLFCLFLFCINLQG